MAELTQQVVTQVVNDMWQWYGPDILSGSGQNQIDRESLADFCIDNFMNQEGLDLEMRKEWSALCYETKRTMVLNGLTDKWYGW